MQPHHRRGRLHDLDLIWEISFEANFFKKGVRLNETESQEDDRGTKAL